MNKFSLTGWFLFFACLIASSLYSSRLFAQDRTVFLGVNVVDVELGEVQKNQIVCVADGKIYSIGSEIDAAFAKDGSDFERVDCAGKFLIPGLMNAHGHLPGPQGLKMPVRTHFLMNVAAGVTSIRSMRHETNHQKILEIASKEGWIAPHVYLSAPAIRANTEIDLGNPFELFKGYKKDGFSHVKYLSGLNPATHELLVNAARKADLPFVGHLPKQIDLESAITLQQLGIEHFQGYTKLLNEGSTNELKRLIELSAKRDVFNCPTVDWYEVNQLTIPNAKSALLKRRGIEYLPKELVDSWKQWLADAVQTQEAGDQKRKRDRFEVLKLFVGSGAPLLIGADDGPFMVPGFGCHIEMKHFSDAGFSNAEILRFATINGARFYNKADEFGAIKKGLRADLVLLSVDPLDDIRHTSQVEGTMVGGRWYSKEKIDDALSQLLELRKLE